MLDFLNLRKKKKVLVVEDDLHIREMLVAIVKTFGFEPIATPDGGEACTLAASQQPAIILMDIMLPTVSGVDAVFLIRSNPKTKDIPIIMCTAKNKIEDVEKSLAAGANDYLTKPFEVEQLRAKIGKYLAIEP
ncbi:MAG: response regulator [Elusimicrobia bacterium]|nr:response regulator [Elusimicrobiota bacterium]